MGNTFEDIQKRMKSLLKNEASKIEGTWTADNIQAVANELAKIYSQDIDTMLPKSFVSTAAGVSLDQACADYGIERNKETFAEVMVTVEGAAGSYANVSVSANGIYFNIEEINIPQEGIMEEKAICTTGGSEGNVSANMINKIIDVTLPLTKICNKAAAVGGYDKESDESLRKRTLDKVRTPSSSGNIVDYKKWALEISGVNKVKVYPLKRGNGTVDIVILAEDNSVAPDVLINQVSSYIEQNRPIGADVLVSTATPKELIVNAVVVAMVGYTSEQIKNDFYNNLKVYLASISFETQLVSYLKIADILFKCEGIIDIKSYTLNSESQSIMLEINEFPVPATPTINIEREG